MNKPDADDPSRLLSEPEFEEYLRRDSQVSHRYHELDAPSVPTALDERILQQARQARAAPKPGSRWRQWGAPLAIAASAVIAVTVLLQISPQERTAVPQAAAPPSPVRINATTPAEELDASPPVAQPTPEPAVLADSVSRAAMPPPAPDASSSERKLETERVGPKPAAPAANRMDGVSADKLGVDATADRRIAGSLSGTQGLPPAAPVARSPYEGSETRNYATYNPLVARDEVLQANNGLQRCDKPMGSLAVVEPQDEVTASLARFNLSSPTSLIRLMAQQSNCFIVVERGAAMANLQQERALREADELRKGSSLGGGQMVAADFVLTPNVVFSEGNAAGVGAAIGGVLGTRTSNLAGVAGALKFKEAQTSMLVADSRSGVQVAAAEGSARKADLRLGAIVASDSGAAELGGYQNTNEGKAIAASLTENFNNIVVAVRDNPSLQREVGTLSAEASAVATQAGAVFKAGDTLVPKVATKLYANPAESAAVVAALNKGDQLIFTGTEQDGFLKVESGNGAGWVKKILVTR